jgi:hypothetical protein
MSAITGEKVKDIPVHSDILPQGKSIHELANFDTRFYKLTQEFAREELNQQGALFQSRLTNERAHNSRYLLSAYARRHAT